MLVKNGPTHRIVHCILPQQTIALSMTSSLFRYQYQVGIDQFICSIVILGVLISVIGGTTLVLYTVAGVLQSILGLKSIFLGAFLCS